MSTTKTEHTPGQWKSWNSGWANAPTIIYVGENAPSLGRNNKLKMNGSVFIAEVSTQNMHLTLSEDVVYHHNDELIVAAPDLLLALEHLVSMAVCWETVDQRKNIQLENSEVYMRARAAISKATGAA